MIIIQWFCIDNHEAKYGSELFWHHESRIVLLSTRHSGMISIYLMSLHIELYLPITPETWLSQFFVVPGTSCPCSNSFSPWGLPLSEASNSSPVASVGSGEGLELTLGESGIKMGSWLIIISRKIIFCNNTVHPNWHVLNTLAHWQFNTAIWCL